MYHIRERRRERQNETAYVSLIATPADLTSPFTVPANANLAISFSAALTLGQLTIDVSGGRQIGSAALDADAYQSIGWFERGKELEFNSAVAGTVTLYLVTNNGKKKVIGTGAL